MGEERIRTTRPDNDRASILAEMASIGSEPAPEAKAATEEPAKPAAPAPNGTPAPAEPAPEPDDADDDADDADTDDEADDADVDDDEESEAAADADTQRRLAIVQRADKRRREAFATERQAYEAQRERDRAERSAVDDKASRFDQIGPRFATDPVGVALDLNVPEDQYEYIAEQFYRMSKKAQEDPRHREAARIARMERQIAERDRRDQERESKAAESRKAQEATEAAHREGAQYLDKLVKRSADGAAGKLAKGAPKLLRRQLGQLALELMGDSTTFPPVKRVLREYEKRKREEYAAAGFDVAALGGTPAPTKAAAPGAAPAAAKTPAEAAPATTENGKAKLRGDAERRQILAEIRAARAQTRE